MAESQGPSDRKGKKSKDIKLEIREDGALLTGDGKVLKKKIVPKTKIADDKGGLDWEVVDKRKSVIVEEDPEKAHTESD